MKLQRMTQKLISIVLVIAFLSTSILSVNAADIKDNSQIKSKLGDAIKELKVDKSILNDNTSKTKEANPKNLKKRFLVKYKNSSSLNENRTIIENKLGKKVHKKKQFKNLRIDVLEIDDQSSSNTIDELRKLDIVESVQLDYPLTPSYIPEDEMYSNQWGLKNIGQVVHNNNGVAGTDINTEKAWDETLGSKDVIVAVIDTGVDISHHDLTQNIYTNIAEIPNNGIDDDGNGFVDDVNGWDFANKDNSVFDNAVEDGHGTHVSGIIAASADKKGVVGTAPNVRILPLKFIKNNVGFTSNVIEAIEYAKKSGARVANCSWGGTEYNPMLEDAIKNSGMLFVCAVGNDRKDINESPVYPASYHLDNVISIAANDNTGKLAWFSNYGKDVDILAPGVEILSTVPNNSYKILNGTSMSAGFVSGTAALVLSKYPNLTPKEVKSKIVNNVRQSANTGLLDAYGALTGNNPDKIKESDTNKTPKVSNVAPECPKMEVKPINKEKALPFGMRVTKANPQQVTISTSIIDEKYSECEIFVFESGKKNPLYHETQNSKGGEFKIKDYKLNTPYSFEFKLKTSDDTLSYCGKFSLYAKNSKNDIVLTYNGVYRNSNYRLFSANTTMADGSITPLASYSETEPNDNGSDQVTFISFSGEDDVTGYISSSSDVDWYMFNINNAGKMNFWLGNIPSGCNYDLLVYKRKVDSADMVLVGSSSNGSNASELVEQKPVNKGEIYFVKVYSSSGSSTSSPYKLGLHNYTTATDDFGNDMKSAYTVPMEYSVYGTIDYSGDVDYFSFTAPTTASFAFETKGDYNIDTVGDLFNASGTNIGHNDDVSSTDKNFSIKANLVANQTYYVSVKHVNSTGTGDYILYISQMENTPSFSVTDVTKTSLQVNVTFPRSGIYGNAIYIYDSSSGTWTNIGDSWNTLDGTYTVSNLKPGTKYNCYMYWYTDKDNPWLCRVRNIEVTTLADIGTLNITNVGCDSITIDATFPTSGKYGNCLYIYDRDNDLWTDIYGSSYATNGTYTISNLNPLSTYTIEVLWSHDDILQPNVITSKVTTVKPDLYHINCEGREIYLTDIGESTRTDKQVYVGIVDGSNLIKYSTNTMYQNASTGSQDWTYKETSSYTGIDSVNLEPNVISSLSTDTVNPNFIIPRNVFNINFEKVKNEILYRILTKLGLSSDYFEPDDIDMFMLGIVAGLDDNFLFGINIWAGLIPTYYEDTYFCTGKLMVDCSAIVSFAALVVGSNNAGNVAFATSAAEGAGAGLCALTGVGSVISVGLTEEALRNLLKGLVCKVVSVAATTACGNSTRNATKTKGKLGTSKAHSKILGDNLAANGEAKLADHAAHHIVAWRAKSAQRARDVLQKCGLGWDYFENGVWLPVKRGISSRTYHPTLHTTTYYETVNTMLERAYRDGGKTQVIQVLREIKDMLRSNTFPF